jgi:glycosyltransferase involved in cell wall biosynthesis
MCYKTDPLVSVVMAVRNGMPFLPAAVESILTQTLHDFEFIVINDGSDDDTQRYLEGLTDPRLRLVSQQNVGPGASANRGIALARGKYIARMDADDLAMPTRLERQARFLTENAGVVLVGTQLAFLCSGRSVLAPRMPRTHKEIVQRFRMGRTGLCNASLMCSATLAKTTPYRIRGSGEDVDFALRLAERGQCENLDEVLYLYRIYAESTSVRTAGAVRRGARFAIEAAKARQAGAPEPSFDDFCREWARRGPLVRIHDRVRDWAFVQYRRSICDRARGNRLRGLMRLCAAGAINPATGARRLIEMVRLGLVKLRRNLRRAMRNIATDVG